MQITASKVAAWTVLTLTGKIDQAGADVLAAALPPQLTGGLVALDLTHIEYITSPGFRVLIQSLKEQTAKGGRLLLGNMSAPLRMFFDMAGLGTVFEVVPDIYDVVRAAP